MNTKKVVLILIAVAFLLITVFSLIGLFAIKKVEVDFAVSDSRNIEEIQTVLDEYNGSNLLFLNSKEVKESLNGYHYLEVLSVEKKYPNVLKLSIKERREIYSFEFNEKVYLTDENGFVLSDNVSEAVSEKMIKLTFGQGVEVLDVKCGSYIETDNNALLTAVFNMAKSVNLTDCIECIEIMKPFLTDADYDVIFKAYTGVEIHVEGVLDRGEQKVINAFKVYDEKLSDYQKTYGKIESFFVSEKEGDVVMKEYYRVTYEGFDIDFNV